MAAGHDKSQFSAVDATLGYLYQMRLGLLCSLQRIKAGQAFSVSIETLDDVTFEKTGGEASELLQAKHHRKGVGSPSDSSSDLWKTFRIWFQGRADGTIPKNALLYLVTTAIAPEGSAASKLRSGARDTAAALAALENVAKTSSNKSNKAGYDALLDADPAERSALFEQVFVLDATPNVENIDGELRQEVFWSAEKEYHDAFLQRLEGWWLRRVIAQLCDEPAGRIGSVELELCMADLREQFKKTALPIDDEILEFELDEAAQAAYGSYTFVRQLELVRVGKVRITHAIQDYYKAFTQRSRWLRQDLVVSLDLQKYEKRLTDEWSRVFEAMREEVGKEATDEAKVKAARSVLKWASDVSIPIRPDVTEAFISRGSLHMLSDDRRIGWHPDFEEKLAALLDAKAGAA